ncbi:uncharacterized protein EAE98_000775 [Botrytis deweyae]|uniref:Uncharacterized protein n=1 Tax=Botrytis deweyae TaxID=2478750 RepID=A0ABQ7IZS3_9HELO|nr:uncharacterized protein EAE98_000775 [Botrytis deweyae]KAF7938437.1 hypothetical protein EAE98_000775 [Botrytis deweyae]
MQSENGVFLPSMNEREGQQHVVYPSPTHHSNGRELKPPRTYKIGTRPNNIHADGTPKILSTLTTNYISGLRACQLLIAGLYNQSSRMAELHRIHTKRCRSIEHVGEFSGEQKSLFVCSRDIGLLGDVSRHEMKVVLLVDFVNWGRSHTDFGTGRYQGEGLRGKYEEKCGG